MKIGVLAVQGAFAEHITTLQKLGIEAIPVRLPSELKGLDGLIIPGGESTSINNLMVSYRMKSELQKLVEKNFPIFGTCAGMILLAKKVSGNSVETIEAMDIEVKRNAFGRQTESFEAELSIPVLGEKPFPGVFIRAPLIEKVGDSVEVLSRLPDGTTVAARQGKLLVSAFHPELTGDDRFHNYFLEIISGKQ